MSTRGRIAISTAAISIAMALLAVWGLSDRIHTAGAGNEPAPAHPAAAQATGTATAAPAVLPVEPEDDYERDSD
jgi:hypothetical protein